MGAYSLGRVIHTFWPVDIVLETQWINRETKSLPITFFAVLYCQQTKLNSQIFKLSPQENVKVDLKF